jgi:ribosome-associated heat shock protein Hsp15
LSLVPVRVDRWLTAARIFKSRTLATEACNGNHVKVDGQTVRPSHLVKVGDRIEARAPRGPVVVVILALADKRLGPVPARALYEDHSPPPPPKDASLPVRPRGLGRPTKQDRRKLDRFRGGF